jgi:iron complex outermembrane recepter protein
MKRYDDSRWAVSRIITASCLFGIMGAISPAGAADSPGTSTPGVEAAPNSDELQEVTVTARREKESIQDIPTSIVVLSEKELETHQLTSTTDIAEFTPNLHIDIGARALNADLSIRGVTAQGAGGDPESNPAVGQYINGIYVGSRIVDVMSTLDIARIEVLRGPQGTLFGKNSTAGAINIVTNRPNNQLEGEVMARTGSHDREDVRLIVNTPFTDTLFARIAVGQDKNNGYYHNLLTGQNANDQNTKTLDAGVRWQPNDQWTFDASWNYMYINENNRGGTCVYVSPSSFTTKFNQVSGENFEAGCLQSQNAGRYNFYADARQYDRAESNAAIFEFAWQAPGKIGFFDELNVTGNLGERKFGYAFLVDTDMTALPVETRGQFGDITYPQGGTSITGELLAHGKVGIADIILGWNHVEEEGHEGSPKSSCFSLYATVVGTGQSVTCVGAYGFYFGNDPLNVSGSGATPFVTNESTSSRSDGFFTHANLQFLDWLRFEMGVRYTREFKDYFDVEGSVTPTNDYRGFTWIMNDSTISLFGSNAKTFSATTPMASINFILPQSQMVDQAMGYLLWSRGFQSGGFNTELDVARIPQLAPLVTFKPETLDNFEVGVKTTLFDRHLRVNLAIFQMNYKNKQEDITIDNINGQFGADPSIDVIQNASEARIRGYELEFQGRLGWGFGIDGGLAQQVPKYTNYNVFDPTTGIVENLSGTPLNSLPKNTFTGNLTWDHTLPNQSGIDLRFGTYYQTQTDRGLTTAAQVSSGQPTQCYQHAYETFNGRLGWTDPSSKLTVALSGKNLANQMILDACTLSIATRGVWHPVYADQRTWALEAVYRFKR